MPTKIRLLIPALFLIIPIFNSCKTSNISEKWKIAGSRPQGFLGSTNTNTFKVKN